MINSATLAGHVTVGDNVILSAHALVHQFVRIGEFAMIGAGSKIVKDIPPYMKAISYSYCVGSNAIGLRRSGQFSREEVDEARLAYKTLFRARRPFSTALEAFRPMVQTRIGRNILEFVAGPSKFGIAGGAPHGEHEFASEDVAGDEG
jgi:UDP-N-acetylglucosamine acyltransferase